MSHINKEDFISLVKENIKREGIDKLINYLESTDFFEAPASSMYHSDYDGGLIDHSYNVFKLLSESDKLDHNIYSMESIAIVSLFHDVCKANFYVKGERNVKSEEGKWIKVPYYKIDEAFPMGHGEKSVYIVGVLYMSIWASGNISFIAFLTHIIRSVYSFFLSGFNSICL